MTILKNGNGQTIDMEALYLIQPTSYGGRGAFARSFVAEGTEVLSCSGPYASVIMRKFRKEVCAFCFAYAFQKGQNKWSIKVTGADHGSTGAGAGVWFCSEDCRDSWVSWYELGEGEGAGWLLEIMGAFERAVVEMEKYGNGHGHRKGKVGWVRDTAEEKLGVPEAIQADDITQVSIDAYWEWAEDTSSEGRKKRTISEWTEALNEFELDTAKFVLDGLVRKIVEDLRASHDLVKVEDNAYSAVLGSGSWPYILASQIRVYRFLRQLFSVARFSSNVPQSSSVSEASDTVPLTPINMLRNYLLSSTILRALLGRDVGNAFGIWELTPDDQESEMLGWGAYVFGSYFNHDCDPNIKKRRDGRGVQFYTTRDVIVGEELCISYVDGRSVAERNAHLKDWFFACRCKRCLTDLESESRANVK